MAQREHTGDTVLVTDVGVDAVAADVAVVGKIAADRATNVGAGMTFRRLSLTADGCRDRTDDRQFADSAHNTLTPDKVLARNMIVRVRIAI